MKLNDLYKLFILEKKQYNKESTIYTYNSVYKNYLLTFFNNILIKDINIKVIESFHNYLNKKNLSTKYKNKINTVLIQLLNYAIKKDLIKYNYALNYGNFKNINDDVIYYQDIIKYQTQEEFNKYISIIKDKLDLAFFTTSFYTGSRCGELQALKWKDLNFKTWKLIINKTLSTKTLNGGYKITNTKNRKNRIIPILNPNKKSLVNLYNYYKIKYPNFNNEYFIFGGIRFYPTTTMKSRMKKYYSILKENNSNINMLTHHQFGRHSHVSYLKHLGATSEQIALRIGDTKEVVEKTYIHFYEDEQDKILDLFK